MEDKVNKLIEIYKHMAERMSENPNDWVMLAKAGTYKMVIEDLEKLLEGEKDD